MVKTSVAGVQDSRICEQESGSQKIRPYFGLLPEQNVRVFHFFAAICLLFPSIFLPVPDSTSLSEGFC